MSIFKVALVVLVLLLGYLLLLPVSIAPVAWTPTPVASLPPPTSLRAIQRIEPVLPDFVGPEGIAADTEGRIYAGLGDGRLLRLSADFGSCTLLDNSGGRPLGLAVSSDGALLIADARSGWPRFHGRVSGQVELECRRCDKRFGYPLDVAVDLRLVRDEAEERAVLADADPYWAENDRLPVRELIEEEVLLALPMLPRCESCENDVANAPPPAPEESSEKPENPFAVLKRTLKTHRE